MIRTPPRRVLAQIGTLFTTGTAAGLSDGDLLERYLNGGGARETAFAAIVARHGPMVLGVCRRVLAEPHDAEDAFQATFLVLVRKARSIARRELLGPWLYGVAFRTARDARTRSARRRAKESQVSELPRAEPGGDFAGELRAVLDEELSRLPERHRKLVVLCDLEGVARKDAAALLGVPEGTVSSRLARARNLLRERLVRRGLTMTATAFAAALTSELSAGFVPEPLAEATLMAALRYAAGPAAGAVPASVSSLSEGVLTAMYLTKLKVLATAVIATAIVLTSAGVLAQGQASPRSGEYAERAATRDQLNALEQKLDRVLEALQRGPASSVPAPAPGGEIARRHLPPPPAGYDAPIDIAPVTRDPLGVRSAGQAVEAANNVRLSRLESRINDIERRLNELDARLGRLADAPPTRATRTRDVAPSQ
jgi:RNA polymerase sigma factor (sigma-70 family)